MVAGLARRKAYLQINCCTVPDIDSLEIGIITVVEGSACIVEFVREYQILSFAVVRFSRQGALGGIRINETCTDVLQ